MSIDRYRFGAGAWGCAGLLFALGCSHLQQAGPGQKDGAPATAGFRRCIEDYEANKTLCESRYSEHSIGRDECREAAQLTLEVCVQGLYY